MTIWTLPRTAALVISLAAATAFPAAAARPLPEGVERLLRQAALADDAEQLDETAELAAGAYPDLAAEIAALVETLQDERAEKVRRAKAAAAASLLAGWSGNVEAGASLSTGNSEESSVALGFAVAKETVEWRHLLRGTADYRRAEGQTTSERLTLTYEPNWFFAPRFYIAGLLGAERDRFAGYRWRLTETLGLGWVALDGEDTRLELEGGPGLRQTRYDATDDEPARTEAEALFRASAAFTWQIAAATRFTQSATALIGGDNRTLEGTSALTLKLNRRISSRISLTVRNESDPPEDLTGTDTLSRVTLIYAF